jgi:hypothetical protein
MNTITGEFRSLLGAPQLIIIDELDSLNVP